jgi:hypothetical protein
VALITNIQKIKNHTEKATPKVIKGKMPIFRCSCGAEILILPDVPAMNKAIKNHIRQHKLRGQPIAEETITQEILIALNKSIKRKKRIKNY